MSRLSSASFKVDSITFAIAPEESLQGNVNILSLNDSNLIATGKKRARNEAQNSEAPPSKRANGEATVKKPGRAARVRVPRPPKVNASAKAALKAKEKEGEPFAWISQFPSAYRCKTALATQPKWHTLSVSTPETKEHTGPITNLKPRLWSGVSNHSFSTVYLIHLQNKEELLAILPEMCGRKWINGMSWLLCQNPMMILDGSNYCFEPTTVDDLTVDLTTYASPISRGCCRTHPEI